MNIHNVIQINYLHLLIAVIMAIIIGILFRLVPSSKQKGD